MKYKAMSEKAERQSWGKAADVVKDPLSSSCVLRICRCMLAGLQSEGIGRQGFTHLGSICKGQSSEVLYLSCLQSRLAKQTDGECRAGWSQRSLWGLALSGRPT